MTIEDRFWSKVSIAGEDDCWLWKGSMPYDYGRFGIGSRTDRTRGTERAHRMAWLLTNGDIPNVKKIKKMYACGNISQSRLASLFGVSPTQIGRIVRGDRWKGLV